MADADSDDPTPGAVVRLLSPEDLSILALETATVAGHTCKLIVLAGAIDPDRLRASIASRLEPALPLRMSLGELDGKPCWRQSPSVDLAAHVVVGDDQPLDPAGLRAAAARIFEQRLDRGGPLWRIDVVPRLTDGGSALIWRLHHALADGATAMRIARLALWDEAPNPAGGHPSPNDGHPNPDGGRPVGRSAGAAATSAAARHRRLAGLRAAAREAPHWHRSPLDGDIGGQREVAFASVELEGLRHAARAVGATLNDAVLTVVAGGLRGWLEARHGRLGPIRVKVPVSLHGPAAGGSDEDTLGNRDSFFCLDLPLSAADPLARLREVSRETRLRKESHDAQQIDALMARLGRVPQLRSFAERILTHPRSFALNVSNVPGPRQPISVLGTPVSGLYTLVEIRAHHALRIAVISLVDTLNFGFTADPTLLPDVTALAAFVQADAARLVAAS